MKQKTALTLALARPHALLLLDEPTCGLDWAGADTLVDILSEETHNAVTVVIVTHEPGRFGGENAVTLEMVDGRASVRP